MERPGSTEFAGLHEEWKPGKEVVLVFFMLYDD
jgi:hypothetical protein